MALSWRKVTASSLEDTGSIPWIHSFGFQLFLFLLLCQDLVQFSSGFTHTPPVGLSITYTSPLLLSQLLWSQDCDDFCICRGEERSQAWLLTFFCMLTVGPPASPLRFVSSSPVFWKITLASMEDLVPCCPILQKNQKLPMLLTWFNSSVHWCLRVLATLIKSQGLVKPGQ